MIMTHIAVSTPGTKHTHKSWYSSTSETWGLLGNLRVTERAASYAVLSLVWPVGVIPILYTVLYILCPGALHYAPYSFS